MHICVCLPNDLQKTKFVFRIYTDIYIYMLYSISFSVAFMGALGKFFTLKLIEFFLVDCIFNEIVSGLHSPCFVQQQFF